MQQAPHSHRARRRLARRLGIVLVAALALTAIAPAQPAEALNIRSLFSSLFGSSDPFAKKPTVVSSPYGDVSAPSRRGTGSGPAWNPNSFQGGMPTLGGKFVGLKTQVPAPQITISCLPLPKRGITWVGTAGILTIFMSWKYYRYGKLVTANSTQTASGIGPNTLDLLARPTPPPGAPALLPHPYYELIDLRIKVTMDNQGVLFESNC